MREQYPENIEGIRQQMIEMAEAVPAVLCLITVNNEQVLYVSPAYERIFGRSCESLYKNPQSWLNYIHPEDCQRVINKGKNNHNQEHEIKYRIIRPDGSLKWVNDRVFPIRNEQNKIYRILRFIQDITEGMQIEETLRDSFQRSVDIVNAIPSGLFICQYEPEESFILIDSNPAAERMTGVNIEEYRGKEINVILPQAKEVGLIDECLKVIRTGETKEIEDLEYKDSRLEENFRIRLFRMSGDQLGIAFENITELKRSGEREAQAYALGRIEMVDTLLHNIGNAINSVTTGIGTLQENLTQNKLTRHFASLATAIREHQDEFTDYVKNNPQGQKVASFILALSDDFTKRDEELARIVNRVRERAQHIADIIRTEKVISGKGIYRKYVNLRKAYDDVISVLQDSIKKRGIEIIVDCNDNPKEIVIQESQFHQMLINLVKNSIEAIDDLNSVNNENVGELFIKIKSYVENDRFILEIIDNGIGIEKGKQELIFRPGYTTKDSGTGLGLHSVANFVKGCDGQIFALSNGIGKGAVMRVVLPMSSVS
jgi:PAS domain S-box-containing protein